MRRAGLPFSRSRKKVLTRTVPAGNFHPLPGDRLVAGEEHGVVLDFRVAGEGQVSFLGGAVGPEWRIHRVRDQSRGGTEIADRFKQAGLTELPREILRVRGWRRGNELIDAPPHVVHDVKLAGVVFIECDDSVVRLRDLLDARGPSDRRIGVPRSCRYRSPRRRRRR